MFTVPRAELMAWSAGILLHNQRGRIFAVNELRCEEAQRLMDEGETIALTENDRIVTTMRLTENGYEENSI